MVLRQRCPRRDPPEAHTAERLPAVLAVIVVHEKISKVFAVTMSALDRLEDAREPGLFSEGQ